MELSVKKLLITALVAITVSACTTVPTQLKGEYTELTPARVNAEAFGTTVRWGGVIIDTRNDQDQTCFEILSRNLGSYMRPEMEDSTLGRFIACKPGFYDPQVFAKGREMTLTGTVKAIEEHPIDDFNYRYPVVDAKDVVLWDKRKTILVYDRYDPFYYPFYGGWAWGYPYYRYPYYGRPAFPGRTLIYTRQPLPNPSPASPRQTR